ncbi:hypothetical protein M422DRAFT_242680 [Sphaerobolus stellatus SS14]|nr:hypothetical protein M422DRAFT_242680 [Sphaerobolus stellatus SS14]
MKIDNLLSDKCLSDKGADIIALMYKATRRAAAKDLWSRECPNYAMLELEKMVERGWYKGMDHKVAFPEQMKVRSMLFDALPASERDYWEAKAVKTKDKNYSFEDVLTAMPKFFVLMGNALATRIGWYIEIRAAGIGLEGKPHFFIEKYKPLKQGTIIDYSRFKHSDEYDKIWSQEVAEASHAGVEVKQGQVMLRYSVEYDAEGNVLTPEMDLRVSLSTYFDQTYVMVPSVQGRLKKAKKPEWAKITSADTPAQWVELQRLPPAPFELMSPMFLKKGPLYELAKWILTGELGMLKEAKHFKWLGQMEGTVINRRRLAPLPKPKPSADDGEVFDIDDIAYSSDDEDPNQPDIEPVKSGVKRKKTKQGGATEPKKARKSQSGTKLPLKKRVRKSKNAPHRVLNVPSVSPASTPVIAPAPPLDASMAVDASTPVVTASATTTTAYRPAKATKEAQISKVGRVTKESDDTYLIQNKMPHQESWQMALIFP